MTLSKTHQSKHPLKSQRHDSFSQSHIAVTTSKRKGRKLVFLIAVACTIAAITSLGILMFVKYGSGSVKRSNDDNNEDEAEIKKLQDEGEKEETITSLANNGDQSLAVQITYDISNDCGWDSEAVMNEIGNSLKAGLIHATSQTAQSILGEFRNDQYSLRQENIFAQNDDKTSKIIQIPASTPVTIDRIVDIEDSCSVGNKCLLIISTIFIAKWEGAKERITDAIVEGISRSFDDGTFFGSIPEDSVVCS
mmetsp:Transcript_2485/g.5369  ORF Transcript_2485/g.5369 Transcript_2485/m.5369 type:complete len:250 (-) Transcript_2485:222-971(-)